MSADPLIDLLKSCVVRIALPGTHSSRPGVDDWNGTGFFVAPDLVLTCAHVVERVERGGAVVVRWQGHDCRAVVQEVTSVSYPDLALLRLEEPPAGHPCVLLAGEQKTRIDHDLYCFGYPTGHPTGRSATFTVEGYGGTAKEPVLNFKLGNVLPGFSGAPLLNQQTGAVCGLIVESEKAGSLVGGNAIPVETIWEAFPALIEQQRAFHERDRRWQEALAAQEARPVLTRARYLAIEKRYLDALRNTASLVEIKLLGMSEPLSLDEIYIRLRLHDQRLARAAGEREREQERLRAEAQERGLHDPETLRRQRQELLRSRYATSFEPEQAIQRYPRCLILGEPGAGKTTLLKYLTKQALSGGLQDMDLVPIYLPLSAIPFQPDDDWQEFAGHIDLKEFAAYYYARRYNFERATFRAYLDDLMAHGRALFLLDALDETVRGDSREEGEANYRRVATAVEELADSYPHIVATTRLSGYRERGPLRTLTELEVLDFRWPEIEQFISNWLQRRGFPDWQQRRERLKTKLQANPSMLTLAANPLLLTQIVLVFEEDADLPERRADLYERCASLLLRYKWDNDRRLVTRVRRIDPGTHERLLRRLAWEMHRRRRRDLERHILLAQLESLLPSLQMEDEDPEALLNWLSGELGLLRKREHERYEFQHLTWQEYLTAKHIEKTHGVTELLPHLGDPWWEEVTLLYAGLAEDAGPLIAHLLEAEKPIENEPPEDVFSSKLILAGRCLVEHAVLPSALRQQLIKRLFAELLRAEFELTRRRTAETLAEIGRAYAAYAFGREINRRLLGIWRDKMRPDRVRVSVIRALCSYGARSLAGELLDDLECGVGGRSTDAAVALGRELIEALDMLIGPDPALFKRLLDKFLSPVYSEIDFAARWLAKAGDATSVHMLLPYLDPAHLEIRSWRFSTLELARRRLAYSCALLAEDDVVNHFLDVLANPDADSEVNVNILEALAERGYRSVVPRLMQLSGDSNVQFYTRIACIRALAKLGNAGCYDRLAMLATDEAQQAGVFATLWHFDFRAQCAYTCAVLGARSHRRELLDLLANRGLANQIRRGLILGLAETLTEADARDWRAPLYGLYCAEPEGELRDELAVILGFFGEPAVWSTVKQAWYSTEIESEERLAEATAALTPLLPVSACLALLKDANIDSWKRSLLARELGRTGRRELLPHLLEIVREPAVSERVRSALAEASGELAETSEEALQIAELLQYYKRMHLFPSKSHLAFSYTVDALFKALWKVSRRTGLLVLRPEVGRSYAYRLVPRETAGGG